MISNPLLEIFCDGNNNIGYGHIRRSLTLASCLESDGVDVRLIGLSETARSILPLPKHVGRSCHIVVFDCPAGNDDRLLAAKKNGQLSVALDWFGSVVPDVNIAVYPHQKVLSTQKSYVGFDYVLLRKEITLLSRSKISSGSENVLIIVGGADVLNQGHSAACMLSDLGLNVTLIQGPLAKSRQLKFDYNFLVDPPCLPQLLHSCDWAVVNGGGCLFEALSLGKAAYVLPQSNEEMNIASFMLQKRAILGLGINELRAFDLDEIWQVQINTVGLIDGLGAARISKIIRDLL